MMKQNILEEPHVPEMAVLEDGTEIRLVPLEKTGNKPLYVSRDGVPYSYVRGRFKRIKARTLNRKKEKRKEKYKFLRHFNTLLHHAVLLAWVGPRPEGYICDHINGETLDNRVENLEWVTPAENIRRRWIMHAKRGEGYTGKKLTEVSRSSRWWNRQYAKKNGILVQLELQFPA